MSLDQRARDAGVDVRHQVATVEPPGADVIAHRLAGAGWRPGWPPSRSSPSRASGWPSPCKTTPPAPLEVTHDPEPSTTATVEEWTPERTRAEGSPVELLAARGPSPSGLDAQLYCIGQAIPTGSPCDRYHPYDPEEDQHWALEVTQAGRSALFDVRGTPWAGDFDEDSLLVQDGTGQAVRFRLLQADGTVVQLRVVSDLAPAIPGPDVMLIEDLDGYGRRHDRARQVRPGAFPISWTPAPAPSNCWTCRSEIEWSGTERRRVPLGRERLPVPIWRAARRQLRRPRRLRRPIVGYTDPGWNWVGFEDWLEPGRMAFGGVGRQRRAAGSVGARSLDRRGHLGADRDRRPGLG